MRRRGKQNTENYDSLLDTMANVVGILIIILVVTQINVGDAVNRIQQTEKEKSDSTEKSISRITEDIKSIEQKIQENENILLNSPESALVDIKREQLESELDVRKVQIAQFLNHNLEFINFSDRVAKLRESVAAQESELRQKQGILNALKMKLGPSAAINVDQKIVRLPNPRPAPAGSQPAIFFCRRGRIAHFDITLLNNLLQSGILNALGSSPGRKFGGNSKPEILANYFRRNYIGDENFRLNVMHVGNQIFVEIDWRDPNAGESIEELQRPESAFNAVLKKIKADKNFLSFNVWSDAFETYLAARQIADENQISAGWIAFDKNEEYRSLLFTSSTTPTEYLID